LSSGAGAECRFDLVEPVNLADNPGHPSSSRAAHRFAHSACNQHVVVLDHRRIPQPDPVVLRAAHPGRVFLKMAQPGDSLASVEQSRAALHRLDVVPGHRRDAA
jgi:hypothetical protein